LQFGKLMYNLWQIVCSKIKRGKSSLQAAFKEIKKKMGLEIGEDNIQLIFNDSTFNCSIWGLSQEKLEFRLIT
jgi:hypothetical protein